MFKAMRSTLHIGMRTLATETMLDTAARPEMTVVVKCMLSVLVKF